jgi:hypothetical protein
MPHLYCMWSVYLIVAQFVRNSPMRSSPLRAVEEETGYAASVVGSDLWESASLDYPGREELYMDQEDDFEPVSFFTTLIKKEN